MTEEQLMQDYNRDTVDQVALALLWLTLHDGDRAWKGFDWEVLDRLCAKGWIDNPQNTAKSVRLTKEGLTRSAAWFEEYFGIASAEQRQEDPHNS
jgi:Domain of unknown function (DUF6429)